MKPSRTTCRWSASVTGSRGRARCARAGGPCPPSAAWATFLKEKFDGATEVKAESRGARTVLVPLNPQFKPHTEQDLVYMASSPDFCEADPKLGSLGTHGRVCNKTSKAIDGCDLLCCGRGYLTRKVKVVERCKCKFHWCCVVKCKQCERVLDEHVCV
ncbi:hypothetical protein C0Q70_02384 [Pomacea canaliculata]|uniref:Protein Wnt n=1 Tax=Pomacea canaliculata TaxID=400727 RepID=A0A2T7PPS5_POMCA|nr:hypothetical protein C0Q70_02384 [Pomacea canaliculata]